MNDAIISQAVHRVDVRITDTTIEIFFNHERIASHKRLSGRLGQYSTIQEYMPEEHQRFVIIICNVLYDGYEAKKAKQLEDDSQDKKS